MLDCGPVLAKARAVAQVGVCACGGMAQCALREPLDVKEKLLRSIPWSLCGSSAHVVRESGAGLPSIRGLMSPSSWNCELPFRSACAHAMPLFSVLSSERLSVQRRSCCAQTGGSGGVRQRGRGLSPLMSCFHGTFSCVSSWSERTRCHCLAFCRRDGQSVCQHMLSSIRPWTFID